MSSRSSLFLAWSVLFFIFFPQATSSIRGDVRIEPQFFQATKTDAECWDGDARKRVASLGWDNDPRANVKISYNKRAKICLVEIDARVVRDGKVVMLSRSVGDTEGREYAYFISKAETHSEAPAIFCQVFLPSGEQLECHSENEFDEVVANLLQ